MPALPPAAEVYAALKTVVIPSAGAAALAVALVLTLGRWAGALASAVGVLAGVAFANWQMKQPYLPWTPGDGLVDWILPVMLVLVGVGLLSRWGGLVTATYTNKSKWWWTANATVWLPRAAALAFVSGWAVPTKLAEQEPYLRWAIAATSLLAWVVLDGLAREGCSVQVVSYLSAVACVAGGVLLYSLSLEWMEIGTIVGMALFGVAVIGGLVKTDISGAIPAAVGFLPAFIAAGRFRQVKYTEVPVEAFVIVALAPLALLPFLVPALRRRNGWGTRLARAVAILIPLAIALYLADRHGSLPY